MQHWVRLHTGRIAAVLRHDRTKDFMITMRMKLLDGSYDAAICLMKEDLMKIRATYSR